MNFQQSMVRIFTFMVLLSTTACLVMYALCSLALLRLTMTGRMVPKPMRSGLLAAVGVFATLFSLWAIVGAGAEAVGYGCVLLGLGVPMYWLVRRQRRAC